MGDRPLLDGNYEKFDHEGVEKKKKKKKSKKVVNVSSQEDVEMGHKVKDTGGLSSADAEQRFRQYGPNAIEEDKETLLFSLFKHYIHGPMQYMILIAGILSGVINHYEDLAVMFILLFVNGTLSFVESKKAGDAVAALQKSLAPKCKVFRDGELREVEAKYLVPGDKIVLKLGDIIPADAELLDGEPLTVDESALTGESLPVTRYPHQEVLSGAVVKTGELAAIVTKTGADSFLGKSAALVKSVKQVGHFQKVLFAIAMTLVCIALVLVFIILGVQLKRGNSVPEVLQLCIIVLVASIPIALPVVATGTMAVGSRKLAKANAIVTRLAAIEELAGMDILCSDKTGTLTKNQLSVMEPILLPGFEVNEFYLFASLASKTEASDAIDTAILSKLPDRSILQKYEVVKFIPFDPVSKRTEAHVIEKATNKKYRVSKGAPQVLFKLGEKEISQDIQETVNDSVTRLAGRGLRPLGLARCEEGKDWEYMGLISLFDPPREDTRATIEKGLEMGVDVKMVTGDHLLIGIETARQLGMGNKFYGPEFFEKVEHMTDSRAGEIIENADGFAQVYPEHKYLIVEKLQKVGHLTGMTGDGVNDAPALKRADVGIAVEGATDAARAAADIVLVSPGLSTIITAMTRSRKIFQRLKNYVIYRINATCQILIFVFIAVIFLHDMDSSKAFALPAIILVLITIINDGTIMSIAYDKVFPSQKPEKWNIGELVAVSVTVGLLGVIESFLVYWSAVDRTFLFSKTEFPYYNFDHTALCGSKNCTKLFPPSGHQNNLCSSLSSVPSTLTTTVQSHCDHVTHKLKGVVYLALAVGGQWSVFVARTHRYFFSRRPGYVLAGLVSLGFLINILLATYWPLGSGLTGIGWRNTGVILGYLCLTFLIKDIAKFIVYSVVQNSPLDLTEAKHLQRQIAMKINMYGTTSEEEIKRKKSSRPNFESFKKKKKSMRQ